MLKRKAEETAWLKCSFFRRSASFLIIFLCVLIILYNLVHPSVPSKLSSSKMKQILINHQANFMCDNDELTMLEQYCLLLRLAMLWKCNKKKICRHHANYQKPQRDTHKVSPDVTVNFITMMACTRDNTPSFPDHIQSFDNSKRRRVKLNALKLLTSCTSI
jgi:hypothetical protein